MGDFEIWIYRLVITVLGIILWWGIQRLIKKFDELINSINELTQQSGQQQEQIKGINNTISDHTSRMNDHAKRIRTIEIEQAKGYKNK
jgi:predicted PurR-regulated permease PerM